VFFYHVVNFS